MKKELACPLCGGRVIETAKGFACENWPGVKGACRFTVWKESYGAGFDEEDVERLVAGESVRKVNTSKDGSKYEADWMLCEDGKKPVFIRVEDEAENREWMMAGKMWEKNQPQQGKWIRRGEGFCEVCRDWKGGGELC